MLELLFVPFAVGLIRGRFLPDTLRDQLRNDMGIRCPVCRWRPTRHDLWSCSPGCGQAWNTFDTHGECPACHKQWSRTQCLRCGEWSPHDDWYDDDQA